MKAGSLEDRPDEFLVEQFKATRDNQYFALLVKRHTKHVFNACRKVLNNDAVAEELTQDTFLSAFSHLDDFHGGLFYSWLWRIARNRCVNHLKSAVVARERSDDGVLEAMPLQEKPQANFELAEQIRIVLDQLAPPQRLCLKLFYLEGYSYREIAGITGFSTGKVKSYLQNGMRRFRLLWENLQREASEEENGEYERRASSGV
jgi:RNA polymerase sigma-70 factor (ECF subfamily)